MLATVVVAVLAPTAAAAPPNDDFDDAIPIRVGQTVSGTINGATVQRAEAPYFGRAGRSLWYRFRATRELMIELSACGASFDSQIGVFAGRSLGSLRVLRIDDNGCDGGLGGRVVFRARRGRSYAIAVVGFPGRGRFRLRLVSIPAPANDDFVDAVPLRLGSSRSGTTVRSTRELGEPRRCCGIPHTVWYRLRVATAGQVRLDACYGNTPWIAVYKGGSINRLTRIAYFRFCRVQFAAEAGVTYRVVVDDRGSWSRFRLSARKATPPSNDDFADATPITLGTTISATTRDATREPGEPTRASPLVPAPFTVWFRLAVVMTTVIEVDPSCGRRVGVFNVYTGEQLSQLQEVSKDPASTACSNGFRFEAPPGVYRIEVEANVFDEGDFTFTARAVPPSP